MGRGRVNQRGNDDSAIVVNNDDITDAVILGPPGFIGAQMGIKEAPYFSMGYGQTLANIEVRTKLFPAHRKPIDLRELKAFLTVE